MDPTESGWKSDSEKYVLKWFSGPQLPDDIYQDIEDIDSATDDDYQTDEVEQSSSDESLYESD